LGRLLPLWRPAEALAGRDVSDLVVLNVGTTGALRDGLSGVYLPSEVINHDINADAVRAIGLDPQESLQIEDGDRPRSWAPGSELN
jgi:adenosylhomocysteine nucleosidase